MEYQCPDCPYVYNEEAGDPDNGISPGTKFEDLPASWVCPICGAEKTGFEQQEWPKPASQDHKIQRSQQLFTLRSGIEMAYLYL